MIASKSMNLLPIMKHKKKQNVNSHPLYINPSQFIIRNTRNTYNDTIEINKPTIVAYDKKKKPPLTNNNISSIHNYQNSYQLELSQKKARKFKCFQLSAIKPNAKRKGNINNMISDMGNNYSHRLYDLDHTDEDAIDISSFRKSKSRKKNVSLPKVQYQRMKSYEAIDSEIKNLQIGHYQHMVKKEQKEIFPDFTIKDTQHDLNNHVFTPDYDIVKLNNGSIINVKSSLTKQRDKTEQNNEEIGDDDGKKSTQFSRYINKRMEEADTIEKKKKKDQIMKLNRRLKNKDLKGVLSLEELRNRNSLALQMYNLQSKQRYKDAIETQNQKIANLRQVIIKTLKKTKAIFEEEVKEIKAQDIYE